jgi:hypothetical protein
MQYFVSHISSIFKLKDDMAFQYLAEPGGQRKKVMAIIWPVHTFYAFKFNTR